MLSTLPRSRLVRTALCLVTVGALASFAACEDIESPKGSAGTAGGGGTSGSGGSGGGDNPQPGPGEVCEDVDPDRSHIYASPASIEITPGGIRHLRLTVDPDYCNRTPISLKFADSSVASSDATNLAFTYKTASVELDVTGVKAGTTSLEVSVQVGTATVKTTVPISVVSADLPTCSGSASGTVNPGANIGGTADLGGASLGLQERANIATTATEEGITYQSPVLWTVQGFDGTVSCATSVSVPDGYTAMGPAITFGPANTKFPREVPMAIPINPALLPTKASFRHIQVSYSGPAFVAPRPIAVADAHIEKLDGGGWVLKFMAPRLGTYQAVFKNDGGTKTFKRKLTHRAVMGVSMGGSGSNTFGFGHHDRFDVVAPLGGPVDWTFLLNNILENHVAGFLPNDGATPPTELAPMGETKFPYAHPSTYNKWWYEYPRDGNGGSFSRREYLQLFRDIALQFGNPISDNSAPNGEQLPAGVDPDAPAVVGLHPNRECAVWIDPISDTPGYEAQVERDQHCAAERCATPYVIPSGYYDRKFNPTGSYPVITVCDGAAQDRTKSPWANTWTSSDNTAPLEVALAVDYNNNGVRDENEPIIAQGREPFDDVGVDKLASKDEPGYQLGVNEDPSGDDYDPQYNPSGTEGNGIFEEGEPFEDVGIDGVANTASSPYDTGEGDGKFTMSKGLTRFFDRDSRGILSQRSTPAGGKLDDAALHRIDLWTDGGIRDLFNSHVAAQHLAGSMAARGRATSYFTDGLTMPGQEGRTAFSPQAMRWDDLPGSVMFRYGPIDPTEDDLKQGKGQHVGTIAELAQRLQTALYFISSRWPDAPKSFVEEAEGDPAPGVDQCVLRGNCAYEFTDSRGRVGPVQVNLPPGYGHRLRQDVRYPVIYLLHGYGQTPEDLGAAILFLANWMNSSLDSSGTRLAKAIIVYVDGRCREGANGNAECIRGTFYADSPRPDGVKLDSWFAELMNDIDTRYRTMGESEIDWTE